MAEKPAVEQIAELRDKLAEAEGVNRFLMRTAPSWLVRTLASELIDLRTQLDSIESRLTAGDKRIAR